MKTMCPPGYHYNGFVATHALWHMMYGYIYMYMYIYIHIYLSYIYISYISNMAYEISKCPQVMIKVWMEIFHCLRRYSLFV